MASKNSDNTVLYIIGGLELLRHAIRKSQPRKSTRVTTTHRQIYDPHTKKIITLTTQTVSTYIKED